MIATEIKTRQISVRQESIGDTPPVRFNRVIIRVPATAEFEMVAARYPVFRIVVE